MSDSTAKNEGQDGQRNDGVLRSSARSFGQGIRLGYRIMGFHLVTGAVTRPFKSVSRTSGNVIAQVKASARKSEEMELAEFLNQELPKRHLERSWMFEREVASLKSDQLQRVVVMARRQIIGLNVLAAVGLVGAGLTVQAVLSDGFRFEHLLAFLFLGVFEFFIYMRMALAARDSRMVRTNRYMPVAQMMRWPKFIADAVLGVNLKRPMASVGELLREDKALFGEDFGTRLLIDAHGAMRACIGVMVFTGFIGGFATLALLTGFVSPSPVVGNGVAICLIGMIGGFYGLLRRARFVIALCENKTLDVFDVLSDPFGLIRRAFAARIKKPSIVPEQKHLEDWR